MIPAFVRVSVFLFFIVTLILSVPTFTERKNAVNENSEEYDFASAEYDSGRGSQAYRRMLDLYLRNDDEPRILEGTDTSIDQHPWQVSISAKFVTSDMVLAHICGGSWINSKTIITAAHCINNWTKEEVKNKLSILYNVTDLSQAEFKTRVAIVDSVIHPNFKIEENFAHNDIALIFVEEVSDATPIQIVTRPIERNRMNLIKQGDQIDITVTGWGFTEEFGKKYKRLQQAELPWQQQKTCNLKQAYNGKVLSTMLCGGERMGGPDACDGDSGGPASITDSGIPYLVGIVSMGTGCGRPFKFGIYTRVSIFLPWLGDQGIRF